jgi:hypothetical protein
MSKTKKRRVAAGAVDFSKILSAPRLRNKWVAISGDETKVVGVGTSPKEAIRESIAHGEKEPKLTKVPKHPESYIL